MSVVNCPSDQEACLSSPSSETPWFEQARYGLFLHWGLYSILSDPDACEWVMLKKRLDVNEYNLLASQFSASKYDPAKWAQLTKRAGMHYAVLTTRHHDGFCLFDTQTTTFNTMQTGAARDLVAEYVQAFREAGLRVGLYHSVMSWQCPAIHKGPTADPDGWEEMVQQTHDQVRELMSNYGKIDLLWYDGCVVPSIQDEQILAKYWRSVELNDMVRKLQPDILINDRSGLKEDIVTCEQRVSPPKAGQRWEACMTLNQSWGYNIHDRQFKSPQTIIQSLIRCARHDGNLLLDIGPRADGTIQDEFVDCLETVGRWLNVNEQAIQGTQRTQYTEVEHVAGPVTQSQNHLYYHLSSYTGPTLRLDGLAAAEQVEILGCDDTLSFAAACDHALDVTGFHEAMPWQLGPLVLKVTMPQDTTPLSADLLGGGESLRVTAGNVPVLGFDPDHYMPPPQPVLTDQKLLEQIENQQPIKTSSSENWCPGWQNWQVFVPQQGNSLTINLQDRVKNAYDMELGIIAENTGHIQIQINDRQLPESFEILHSGSPDTLKLSGLVMDQGTCRVTIHADQRFGLYAMRCSPCWRLLPANQWMTIGPFHTDFEPEHPVSDVLAAMRKVYSPEKHYDPKANHIGVNGIKLQWTHNDQCAGEHSDEGVNFPYRCGDQFGGVCFARTVITSPEDREAEILIGCDWWANAWINGQQICSSRRKQEVALDGAQFSRWKPMLAKMKLKEGANVLLVKCHPGARANWFTCRISDPGDLLVEPK
jgi:alpha-L-fucosidase